MTKLNKNNGVSIIGIILLCLIVIFLLKINVKSVINSPTGQANINYIKQTTKEIWSTYLKKPVSFFWEEKLVGIFGKDFVDNVRGMFTGNLPNLEKFSPTVPIGNSN